MLFSLEQRTSGHFGFEWDEIRFRNRREPMKAATTMMKTITIEILKCQNRMLKQPLMEEDVDAMHENMFDDDDESPDIGNCLPCGRRGSSVANHTGTCP
jgi:hypothetical protein